MRDFKPETCCFTGHRDIPVYEERKILARVRWLLFPLLNRNVGYFGVGGSVGFDRIAAEYLLDQRDREGKRIKNHPGPPLPGLP